jgi:K+-sensing histidine kinase KdpD
MTSQPESVSSSNARQQQLHQLGHDVKTYLSVVTMGVVALEEARNEPEAFAELVQMINEDGVAPLKQLINDLIKLACQPDPDRPTCP